MFKKIFESAPVPYRLPSERAGIPNGVGLQGLYHPELVTSPRIYSESLVSSNQVDGIFVSNDRTATSEATITVVGWTDMIYWPGWQRLYWKFNATTGAFISRGANPATYYDYNVYQTVDGSVWRVRITGTFVQIDTVTLEAIEGTVRSSSEFGVISVYIPLVDRLNNTLVAYTSDDLGKNTISVYNWTTGAWIRTIPVSGAASNIVPEDDHRCYVMCSNGIMNLVDYISGEILSTLATPIPKPSNDVNYAFDLLTRRMLAIEVVADAEDGAGLSVITGYYPVPQPVAVTKPIPLKPIRANRASKVIVRTFGDAGEGINAGRLTVGVTDDATLSGGIPAPDTSGCTVFQVTGVTPGTTDINVTLDVA